MIAGLDPVDGLRSMLGHDFNRHAFLAGTFVAVAAGLIGYFVVLRNQVFTGDALSHVAFTGSLASLAVGVDPLVGLYAVTVLGALGMGALGGRPRSRDVVIGTTFAWLLGLGVLFLSLYTTSHGSSNGTVGVTVLFGSIYGLTLHQSLVAAVVAGVAALALVGMARPLLFASVDADVAAARGLPVRSLGLGFLALVGVTAAASVQAVGALLIFGLMVTPAAAAQRITANPYRGLALSALLSLTFMWTGLTLSYEFQRIKPSVTIVTLAFVTYAGVTGGRLIVARAGRGSGRDAARPRPRRR